MKELVEFTEHIYDRLYMSIEGITEEELRWQRITEMNTIKKILRHTARISFLLLPQVVEGTTKGDWDDDYEQLEHSLPEILRDLESGKIRVLEGLRSLKARDFEIEIPLWGGTHKRAEGINMLVGDIIYHAGQIALLRGAYRRAKHA